MVHILRAIMLLMMLMPRYILRPIYGTIITMISFINTLLSADAYHIHGAYVPRDGTLICILMIRDTAHHITLITICLPLPYTVGKRPHTV